MTLEPSDFLTFDRSRQASVAFVGRDGSDPAEGSAAAAQDELADVLARLQRRLGAAAPSRGAENRQVHSARCVEASPGARREADGLWTAERDLALAVYTADCVPVLLAGPTAVGAAHAGWRGIVAGVVGSVVGNLPDPPSSLTAWIGPSIGPCCYQVSEEVAHAVAAAAGSRHRIPRLPRPHLDLVGAAIDQLAAAGICDLRVSTLCTRCERHRLWSYRGHGKTGRRNYAIVWRR